MRKFFIALLIYVFSASQTVAAQMPMSAQAVLAFPAGLVGITAAVKGAVTLSRDAAVGRVVGSGEKIFLNDYVTTDAAGHLQILLLDQTVFTLGPNSSMKIDTFVYDPATHDGQIEATIAKGVFRFITGNIAHKKPENMAVHLPVGTIGVRGTIVTGEVSGGHSLVVLLGPGDQTDTGHRIGSFVLSSDVNGTTHETRVTHSEFGAEIAGLNEPPSGAFRVPDSKLGAITGALDSQTGSGNAPARDDSAGRSGSGAHQDNSKQGGNPPGGGDSGGGGEGRSGSDFSGQSRMGGLGSLGNTASIANLGGRLGFEAARSSQAAGDKTARNNAGNSGTNGTIQDGLTTLTQLRSLTQAANTPSPGVFHYHAAGLGFASDLSGSTYDFQTDIDFGNALFGGGHSKLTVSLNEGSAIAHGAVTLVLDYAIPVVDFSAPSTDPHLGSVFATFQFLGLRSSPDSNIKADLTISVENKGGIIAKVADSTLTLTQDVYMATNSMSGAGEAAVRDSGVS